MEDFLDNQLKMLRRLLNMNLVLRGKVTFVDINLVVIPYRHTLSKIMKGLMIGFSNVKYH